MHSPQRLGAGVVLAVIALATVGLFALGPADAERTEYCWGESPRPRNHVYVLASTTGSAGHTQVINQCDPCCFYGLG